VGSEMVSKPEIMQAVKKEDIRFIQMQFMDILGTVKNVTIPAAKLGGRVLRWVLGPRLRHDRGVGHAPQARPEHFRRDSMASG